MNTSIKEESIVGGEPTREETELVAWAEEAVRKSLPTVQESLRQMVTLSTALLAGSAALLSNLPAPMACKGIASLLLLVALASALWGSFPREAIVDIRCPEEIKKVRVRGTIVRMRCLKIAGGCLVFALFLLIGGVLGVSH
jgi:hypothetical protein